MAKITEDFKLMRETFTFVCLLKLCRKNTTFPPYCGFSFVSYPNITMMFRSKVKRESMVVKSIKLNATNKSKYLLLGRVPILLEN